MTRPRSDRDDSVQGTPVDAGRASGARAHEERRGVSSASAARTRTMAGETVEFKTVDYRPAQGASAGAPRATAPATGARLGRAEGVSSLRGGKASARASARTEGLPRRTKVAIAAALVLLAAVVFVGGYFFMRDVFHSVNDGAGSAESALYATDAYTVVAVTGADGSLEAAYLGYVDSINGRVGFCRLDPSTYYNEDGEVSVGTLGEVYARRGLEGLEAAVSALAAAEVPTSFALTPDEFDAMLGLTSGAAAAELAVQVWDGSQRISAGALQGLLVTVGQVDGDVRLVFDAPVDEQAVGGSSVEVLRHQEWLALVHGMRDPFSGA